MPALPVGSAEGGVRSTAPYPCLDLPPRFVLGDDRREQCAEVVVRPLLVVHPEHAPFTDPDRAVVGVPARRRDLGPDELPEESHGLTARIRSGQEARISYRPMRFRPPMGGRGGPATFPTAVTGRSGNSARRWRASPATEAVARARALGLVHGLRGVGVEERDHAGRCSNAASASRTSGGRFSQRDALRVLLVFLFASRSSLRSAARSVLEVVEGTNLGDQRSMTGPKEPPRSPSNEFSARKRPGPMPTCDRDDCLRPAAWSMAGVSSTLMEPERAEERRVGETSPSPSSRQEKPLGSGLEHHEQVAHAPGRARVTKLTRSLRRPCQPHRRRESRSMATVLARTFEIGRLRVPR